MSGVDENESAEVAAVGAARGWRFLGARELQRERQLIGGRSVEGRVSGLGAGRELVPVFVPNNCCSRGFCVFLDPTSGCRTQQKTATILIRGRSIVPACNDHFTRNVGNRAFAVVYLGSTRPATRLSGVSKRAKPGAAAQASVGATLWALTELPAAVSMAAISVAANREKRQRQKPHFFCDTMA